MYSWLCFLYWFATAPLVTGALTWPGQTTNCVSCVVRCSNSFICLFPLWLYASSHLLQNRSSRCLLCYGANLLVTKTSEPSQNPGSRFHKKVITIIFVKKDAPEVSSSEEIISLPRLCIWHKNYTDPPQRLQGDGAGAQIPAL